MPLGQGFRKVVRWFAGLWFWGLLLFENKKYFDKEIIIKSLTRMPPGQGFRKVVCWFAGLWFWGLLLCVRKSKGSIRVDFQEKSWRFLKNDAWQYALISRKSHDFSWKTTRDSSWLYQVLTIISLKNDPKTHWTSFQNHPKNHPKIDKQVIKIELGASGEPI